MSSSHDPHVVLDRVSFALPDGRVLLDQLSLGFARERTGIVGANGSGKSTLARIVAGELAPTSGRVLRHAPVGHLPQRPAADPARSVAAALGIADRLAALRRVEAGSVDAADWALVGTDGWDLRERCAAALARVGLPALALDRPLGDVSGGEATRVALAALLLAQPALLVLDEPTNHLDEAGRARLADVLATWPGGLVIVSHDRRLLEGVDRIVELSARGARVHGGDVHAWRRARDAEDAAAAQQLAHARATLRAEELRARETRERQQRRTARGARDARSANMPKILLGMRRERSERTSTRLGEVTERALAERRDAVREAQARVEERLRPAITLDAAPVPAGRTVVALRGVTLRHAGAAVPTLRDVSLEVVGPERIGVTGANGSGKTTLLRALAGQLHLTTGERVLGVAPAQVRFADQHAALLDENDTALGNVRCAHPDAGETAVRLALARFLFRGDAALRPARALSGGERLRLALCCLLHAAEPPALLVLDEPTSHLDLEAVEAVEAALRDYAGALVVVSHDESFLDALALGRRLRVDAGRVTDA